MRSKQIKLRIPINEIIFFRIIKIRVKKVLKMQKNLIKYKCRG